MRFALIIFVTIFITNDYFGQDCEVKIPELAGEYEGKCRRGSAHGVGKAMGTDTYEGEFKRGLPHGEGTYTYANGNVYKGSFEKGQKVGKGVMTFSSEEIPTLEGYWIDDEYAGKDEKVYELIDRSTSIKNVRFRRVGNEINQISFKFTNQGKPVKSSNVIFECPNAVLVTTNDFETVFSISEFPITGNVRFRAAAMKTSNGSSEFVDGQAEFELTFKGEWEVTIEMNNK